jgi:hypothetical protein
MGSQKQGNELALAFDSCRILGAADKVAARAESVEMTAICRLLRGDWRFFFHFCGGVPAMVGYPSGQRGQTVNLLAYAFDGSNPSPTTIYFQRLAFCIGTVQG